MLYSRPFTESCREHKPISLNAFHDCLDAKNWIPAGSHIRVQEEHLDDEIHGPSYLSRERA